MNAQVIDLAHERRRRERPHSIEIAPEQLAASAAPHCRRQLAVMLDAVEFEFTPQATLIERMRYTHSAEDLASIVRITLEGAGNDDAR